MDAADLRRGDGRRGIRSVADHRGPLVFSAAMLGFDQSNHGAKGCHGNQWPRDGHRLDNLRRSAGK
jgi:hypothetical protein